MRLVNMLTIFTIPKSFVGHSNIIQRNAVKSWLQLAPRCEIMLFGDDAGVAETAKELSVEHFPDMAKNKFGTPLLSPAFDTAQKLAKNDIIMYANADVIFFQDLIETIQRLNKPPFLVCGRRWDLDVTEGIDFEKGDWTTNLLHRIRNEGKLHGYAGIDYFIFSRNTVNMPDFSVGRPGWDGWLVYDVRMRKIPVINATEAITVIHQNHDYLHSLFPEKNRVGGPELKKNTRVAGGGANMMTLREADWVLNKRGLERPRLPLRILSLLALFYPWRWLLGVKRTIRGEV